MGHKWSLRLLFAAMAFAAPSMTSQAQTTGRCPAGGSTVVATGLDTPAHLTLDGDFLYFVDEFIGVTRVAKSGGVPERFSGEKGSNPPFVYGGAEAFDIAGDARREGPGAPFNVFRVKPNGHGLFNLAKGGGGSMAVDETFLYYLDTTGTRLLRTCKLAGL
jgi:hypothetical protein